MNIRVGQGFKYFDKFGYEHYGVIVNNFPDRIRFFPVVPCYEGHQIHRSFDDFNARDEDKDNVRLNFCPPSFEELGTYYDLRRMTFEETPCFKF